MRPSFSIGIEFEGMVRKDVYKTFRAHLLALGPIQFGRDNSVRGVPRGFRPVEIRTHTLPYARGMKVFEQMLSYLYLASESGDFLTNRTCGLHINVSEKGVFDARRQVPFYCHILRRFDEMGVLRTFGRVRNRYCRPVFKGKAPEDLRDIQHAFRDRLRGDKYLSVALRNSPQHGSYDGPRLKAHRIEFRAIGNEGYHLRFDDLKKTVDHIDEVLREACAACFDGPATVRSVSLPTRSS